MVFKLPRVYSPVLLLRCMSSLLADCVQKSKVAARQFFGEDLKREEISDSYSLSRATEVAYEFSVRR